MLGGKVCLLRFVRRDFGVNIWNGNFCCIVLYVIILLVRINYYFGLKYVNWLVIIF